MRGNYRSGVGSYRSGVGSYRSGVGGGLDLRCGGRGRSPRSPARYLTWPAPSARPLPRPASSAPRAWVPVPSVRALPRPASSSPRAWVPAASCARAFSAEDRRLTSCCKTPARDSPSPHSSSCRSHRSGPGHTGLVQVTHTRQVIYN